MTQSKSPPQQTALLAQLADETRAKRLVGLGFDFLMGQPVSRFVSPERVLTHVREALRPAHVERVLTEHVRGFLHRDLKRAGERNDRVLDYLTPEALTLFRHLAEQPVTLDRRFLEGLVEQDAMRHLLRVVVEETISRFVQMLKPGGSSGPFSKGLFAKLGAQMETQLQRAATAFVSTSLDFLLKRLAQVLATPETERQLGRLRREGFEHWLRLRTRTLWRLAHQLPLDELLAAVPGILRHNLAREEIQGAILAEAEAALQTEGERLVGALVEPGSVAQWRDLSVELGGPLLAEFAATEEVLDWLKGS
ncbi:MAG: hypothetical protein ABI333_01745 [bacterium]